jgi:hypothetical protein
MVKVGGKGPWELLCKIRKLRVQRRDSNANAMLPPKCPESAQFGDGGTFGPCPRSAPPLSFALTRSVSCTTFTELCYCHRSVALDNLS